MHPYRPPLTRALVLPAARVGTSPWAPGGPPCRPLYRLGSMRRWAPVRRRLFEAVRDSTIPADRAPIIDARVVSLSVFATMDDYAVLRGLMRDHLPTGVRPTALVRWAPPGRRLRTTRRAPVAVYWTARVMGALWLVPDLHPHSRWPASPWQWLDAFHRWYEPVIGWDGGLVLDVRMLALAGVPIPLPPAMAEAFQPHVRCLCLADVPTRAQEDALGWPTTARPWLGDAPFLPGASPRYSTARWAAFVDQFPDAACWVPAARSPADVPPWLADRCRGVPSCLPDGAVWPPPPHGLVPWRAVRVRCAPW